MPNFRAQLEDVAARVKTGESISEAFEAQGGFPLMYTTTLLAGERSGNLEEVLERYLRLSAGVADVPQEAAGVADLSGGADDAGDRAVHLPDHVCGAAVCGAVRAAGDEAAGDDAVHAGAWARTRSTMGCMLLPVLALIGVLLLCAGAGAERARDWIDRMRIKTADLREDLAEVPGGAVFADAVDAADGRSAAGAVAGDGGAVDCQPAGIARRCFQSVETVREGKGLAVSPGSRRRCFRSCRRR